MHVWRSQTDRKIVNFHGLKLFFHTLGQLLFVWSEPFVPVSKHWKRRQHERNPDRHA